jgi:hypothetical protein
MHISMQRLAAESIESPLRVAWLPRPRTRLREGSCEDEHTRDGGYSLSTISSAMPMSTNVPGRRMARGLLSEPVRTRLIG